MLLCFAVLIFGEIMPVRAAEENNTISGTIEVSSNVGKDYMQQYITDFDDYFMPLGYNMGKSDSRLEFLAPYLNARSGNMFSIYTGNASNRPNYTTKIVSCPSAQNMLEMKGSYGWNNRCYSRAPEYNPSDWWAGAFPKISKAAAGLKHSFLLADMALGQNLYIANRLQKITDVDYPLRLRHGGG